MKERRTDTSAPPMNGAAGPDFARLTASMLNGWSEINNHMLAFAQTSIQNNMDAATQLGQCTSPQDVVETQFQLARKNYQEYFDEMRQMGDMLVRLSSDAAECLSPRR